MNNEVLEEIALLLREVVSILNPRKSYGYIEYENCFGLDDFEGKWCSMAATHKLTPNL